MGLFSRTAAKTAGTASPKKSNKKTVWLTAHREAEEVGEAVHELVRLDGEIKARNAQMAPFKTVVQNWAEDQFIEDVARIGVLPETPMVVQNSKGETVTYVVQDRSSQYKLKDEQFEGLVDLLGMEDALGQVYDETSFSFSREIMALPGVQEVVERHLEAAIAELTAKRGKKEPLLSEDLAGELLVAEQKRTFRPGIVSRLGLICGSSTSKMARFLEIAGSTICRYIRT